MRCGLLTIFMLGCGGTGGSAPVQDSGVTPTPSTTVATPGLCGNGIVDGAEACDDGNAFSGDGCGPDCTVETGLIEVEPNDAWDSAQDYLGPTLGGLPEGDVDCFSVDVGACEALTAQLLAPCVGSAVLTVRDPEGRVVASGTEDASGCAVVDPVELIGARFMAEGPHTVCVSGLLDGAVPTYTLSVEVGPSSGLPVAADEDLDLDGTPDSCDNDRDGDGVDDVDDNCIDVPNGASLPPLAPSSGGFIRDWLALAPLVGLPSALDCLPSDDELLGGDANQQPMIGDVDQGLTWIGWTRTTDRLDFLPDWGGADTPREVYLHTNIRAASAGDAVLSLGADDGVRAWLDGAQVLEVSSCQGTNIDQFQADVTLTGDWQRLTIKVRDQGGGWGLYARFLDSAGAPITALDLSLATDGVWVYDQTDSDGDGVGDVCDPTP